MDPVSCQKTLRALSLDEKTVVEVATNTKLCQTIQHILDALGISLLEKRLGNLIYTLSAKSQWMKPDDVFFIASYIKDGRVGTSIQLDEALAFFKQSNSIDVKDPAQIKNFEQHAGVGLAFTAEDIQKYVSNFIEENKKEISEKPNHPGVLAKLRDGLKFADRKLLIDTYNAAVKTLVICQEDKIQKKEPPKAKKGEDKIAETAEENQEGKKESAQASEEKEIIKKYRTEKLLARDLSVSLNSPEILRAHQERTGNCVVTRFPPEPNGYLHIGHCKAMRFNFKIAADYNGYTYLRYDDTNPEAESQEYIDKIKECVLWMGYTPKFITFASDNFDRIYEITLRLIREGKAFVCKLPKEEAKRLREAKEPSPYRDSSPEANLSEFQKMKAGFYDEGEACLRAKIDFTNDNPTLRDPVIYRVKFVPHPHIGSKWCIYPLYDFVHSLCDSFEDITHSLCTLEFEGRRDLYYWSLNELNLYKPFVWEYSRLNISFNVLSKRKLLRLVNLKLVDGWDDPRLFTIVGIRRRGYPPEAVNNFCDLVSVSRRGNDNVIQYSVLEHCIRQFLYEHAPKTFAVLEAAELELTNLSEVRKIAESGLGYSFSYGPVNYVEKSDVRLADSKEFFGIAPGKIVRLKYGPFVKINEVSEDGQGSFKVKGEIVPDSNIQNYKKIKGILHFIEKSEALACEVRIYERLFNAEFPGEATGNFLDDYNKDSKRIIKTAKINKGLLPLLKPESRFQFERLGYFIVDQDSNLEAKKLVFNKIVSLKDNEKVKALVKG